jgi:hypothetical protein
VRGSRREGVRESERMREREGVMEEGWRKREGEGTEGRKKQRRGPQSTHVDVVAAVGQQQHLLNAREVLYILLVVHAVGGDGVVRLGRDARGGNESRVEIE